MLPRFGGEFAGLSHIVILVQVVVYREKDREVYGYNLKCTSSVLLNVLGSYLQMRVVIFITN